MLEQTLPCQEMCKLLRVLQLLHITLGIKLLDEIIEFDDVDYIRKSLGPLGGTIHVLHVPHKWY